MSHDPAPMIDSVRPSVDGFRTIYEQGFETWAALHATATAQRQLPPSHLAIHQAFRHVPPFPPNLRPKHVRFPKHSQIYATGSSAWDSSGPCSGAEHGLPFIQQPEQVPIASQGPITLPTDPEPDEKEDWMTWFQQKDHSYLAVLILAWSYILSARWVEMMPESTSLLYNSSMAHREEKTASSFGRCVAAVDIKDAGPAEARWWAAVLAPDQGWQASMTMGGDIHFAPWSIRRVQPAWQFGLVVSFGPDSEDQLGPPTALEALRFLDGFCHRRNITDQSQAALAAVLLLPSMGTTKGIQLPAFTSDLKPRIPPPTSSTQEQHSGANSESFPHNPIDNGDHLDRLMSLSCHTKGVRPMLLSSFFNPSIECNTATPWLQGSLTAIRHLAQEKPGVLGRMLMDRQPNVAPLWVGAIVLGLQQQILRDVSSGMIPIDLLSAAWSETTQSFIQEQTSEPLVTDANISRADQCRLLFLSRTDTHKRVPVCQWRPFGENPARDTDLEVQAHAQCEEHRLRYRGFTWDCADGTTAHHVFTGDDPSLPKQQKARIDQAPVDFSGLDPEKDFISENATRNIFGWLRVEGYASGERDIWEHEWFDDDGDDDEDQEESQDSCGNTHTSSVYVETWLMGVSEQGEKLAAASPNGPIVE